MEEITDKIAELRELFREQFGVEVKIDVYAIDASSAALSRELANYISFELASQVKPEEITTYANSIDVNRSFQWVGLDTKAGFRFAGYYWVTGEL